VLRTLALGLAGALALAGMLDPLGFVLLLGASSVLSAWGAAGKYTLIAELLPAEQRVAGNTVFGLSDQASFMIGPALAGIVTALAGPAVVIAADAASWAVLAISYARVTPMVLAAERPDQPEQPEKTGVWALIRSAPVLPGLLAMSFFFYLLYGPVEVALPVHIAGDLHGSAAPPDALTQVLAARGSLLILASPLGTAIGGPLVAAIGARGTLMVSALGTVAIGVAAATILLLARQRRRLRCTMGE
jgi:hypothetical protein